MKFMKLTESLFHKFHMKWPLAQDPLYIAKDINYIYPYYDIFTICENIEHLKAIGPYTAMFYAIFTKGNNFITFYLLLKMTKPQNGVNF